MTEHERWMRRMEQKLEDMSEQLDALCRILVRRKTVTERAGLNKDTLSRNTKITKYEEVGHRRTYIEVGEISVVKKRRKRK